MIADNVMEWEKTEKDLERELVKWARAFWDNSLDINFGKDQTLKVDINNESIGKLH